MKPKILCIGNISENARKSLESVYSLENVKQSDCIGIFAVDIIKIDKEYIDEFESLLFIAAPRTNIDHINAVYAQSRGIEIFYLNDKGWLSKEVFATAEFAWLMLMQLLRADNKELNGKTLGIIGYGRVGQQVERFAKAFNVQVFAYDEPKGLCIGYPFVNSLESILSKSDIVSIHVGDSENEKSTFCMTKEHFNAMKSSSYFINTSRSRFVDGNALLNVLQSKKLSGAAIDVMEDYSDELSQKILDIRATFLNLIITSHIAGNTIESREKTDIYIVEKIIKYTKGGKYEIFFGNM